MQCLVPMSELVNSPFDLQYQDLVTVRVSAYNQWGWSSVSPVNTAGATVKIVPVQMSPPSRGSDTSISQIQVDWTPLTTDA